MPPSTALSRSRTILLLDLLLVFLFAAALIQPLFRAKYLNRWDSIESTFIADGRFLKDHWPHPQWQPLWYCGTRYDYIYPPALRYGTALLAYEYTPVQAYHIYTALFYCLGIAGVYFLVRVMSESRGAAWLAAAASALVSPAFLLIREARWDSPHRTPWRLWVLLRYGEGPHISSLAWLPFALAFAYLALRARRPAALAAAALFSALVALTNFYGATSLAVFYAILVWSVWVTHRDRRVWLRAAAIPLLAYGFAAFWLTPSYLRITIQNLRWVALPGNHWSQAVFGAVAVIFMTVTFRTAAGKTSRAYAVFIAGSLLFLSLMVLGDYRFQFHVAGNARRLVPELDLAMTLAGVELLRRLWNWPASVPSRVRLARALAVLIVLGSLWSARHYVRRAWESNLFPPEPAYQERVEYRMSEWMATHFPQARTLVTGSIRFWWDTWHDLAQVGGGSDQGLLNQYQPPGAFEVTAGSDIEGAVRWLTAFGADAVIVPDHSSQEVYHDFVHPHKFAGVLPVLYDGHQGNVIYQVPHRYPSLAHVVERTRFEAMPPLPPVTNLDALRAYTGAVENGPDSPATARWHGTDAIEIHARVGPGQSILLQETYDPAWHAYLGGKSLPVHKDPIDFSVIDAPPGDDDIRYVFETPLENRIGWGLTLLSVLAAVALASRDRIHRPTA
jgi:hypothetical protein